jgi:hypothetical protein
MSLLTDDVASGTGRTYREDGIAARDEPEVPLERNETVLERNETVLERADRNLTELLQEVRLAQNGVQVLFGFLLALAFQSRFRATSEFQRIDYLVTLLAAGGSAILMIAPTAFHRILFRRGDKEYLVKIANRVTMAGLGAMAIAMVGVILLITDFLFGSVTAAIVTGCAAGGCLILWFVLPVARRRRLTRSPAQAPPTPTPTDGAGGF